MDPLWPTIKKLIYQYEQAFNTSLDVYFFKNQWHIEGFPTLDGESLILYLQDQLQIEEPLDLVDILNEY